MDMSWKRQTEILQDKFEELYSKISNTKPTTEMAIYCINAVINAALKFPLQVAAIPRTVIKGWDSKHRGLVKKAGYLPRNTSPELLHMPKKLGGKGLQSLEHEIDIVRVQTQMRLINTDSKAGAVVRAAKKRADRTPEKKTIQYHTQEALKRWDMSITGLEEFDCIQEAGIVSQRKIDLCTANNCTKTTCTAHAFGDGATWQKEGITGWGMHIIREGGEVVEGWGRTPGNQNNDSSETYAILQSLLHTHPDSDLHMYCDNQGCVHKWKGHREGSMRKRDRNAAMWSRIDSLRDQRNRGGAETVMHWIQSHVQDETKRTRVTSMIQCACREASGREECTEEGEDHHWLHEGNDRADELANRTRGMDLPDGAIEAVRGEEDFILADDNGTAQGEYRPWISEKVTNMYIQQAKSVGLGRVKEAKEWSQRELWSSMIKNLDTPKGISWRFWSRLMARTLPVNHKLSVLANSNNKDNIYNKVYRDELGENGECKRVGCTCDTEDTDHAIWGCEKARERWIQLETELEVEWHLKGWNWEKVSWITTDYEQWDRVWTAAGAVPEGINGRLGMRELSTEMYSKVKEAARRCSKCAEKIWEERNKENEDWIDSKEGLKERKKEATKTEWRFVPRVKEKIERPKKRIQQKIHEREEHL